MNLYIIPGAVAVTLLVMFIVNIFSKRPLRGLWVLALIVFLAVWGSQLWIQPVGPVAWGVAWLPMFVIAAVFWFLIVMLIPPLPEKVQVVDEKKGPGIIVIGLAFWIILLLLIVVIAAGIYRITTIPAAGITY
jgi:hypothetical protein